MKSLYNALSIADKDYGITFVAQGRTLFLRNGTAPAAMTLGLFRTDSAQEFNLYFPLCDAVLLIFYVVQII